MRAYRSFEELNRELKILKLQSEIHKRKIAITTNEIKEELSPVNLLASFTGSIAKKAFIAKVVDKLIGKVTRR